MTHNPVTFTIVVMKEHRLALLLGLLGIVSSLTILLAIAFAELRGRETLTTKIKQVDESQAAQTKPQKVVSPVITNPDDILAAIDTAFIKDSQGQTTPINSPLSKKSTEIDLGRRLEIELMKLNKEANKTFATKEMQVQSEASAVISDLQGSIQKLEQIKKTSTTSVTTAIEEFNSLQLATNRIPRAQIRRRAALLYAYNAALATKIQEYKTIVSTDQAQICIQVAEENRIAGLGLLNGVLSQIGLFEIIESQDASLLFSKLQTQITQAKKSFDTARTQIKTCNNQFLKK